jgi:hypothetical protein
LVSRNVARICYQVCRLFLWNLSAINRQLAAAWTRCFGISRRLLIHKGGFECGYRIKGRMKYPDGSIYMGETVVKDNRFMVQGKFISASSASFTKTMDVIMGDAWLDKEQQVIHQRTFTNGKPGDGWHPQTRYFWLQENRDETISSLFECILLFQATTCSEIKPACTTIFVEYSQTRTKLTIKQEASPASS